MTSARYCINQPRINKSSARLNRLNTSVSHRNDGPSVREANPIAKCPPKKITVVSSTRMMIDPMFFRPYPTAETQSAASAPVSTAWTTLADL